jgi:hypothetical protein
MAYSPVTNPGQPLRWIPESPSNFCAEPHNHDLISTTDAASFTFGLSDFDYQLDGDLESSSNLFELPGNQMDFSSQGITARQTDQLQGLDQQPQDKTVQGHQILHHETAAILPNSGAGSAQTVSPNQYASVGDEPWDRYIYVVDSAEASTKLIPLKSNSLHSNF